jgi:lathosterol oxidase
MDTIFLFLKYYYVIFLLLLFGYYLIPAGLWYYLFFIRNREKWKHMRIQKKFPGVKQIRREIKYSILSVAIFSFISVFLYYCIINGRTKMYFQISDYGTFYFIVSPIIIILIHDALFYWSHRLMHIKKIFKYFHLVHHKSTNPSPFSIYAFQPGEALIEYAIYPVIFFLLPVHPFALMPFMLYSVLVNLAGHGGFEFMPDGFRKHRIFRWQNSVTNHDMHHTNVKCNYGFYFTFWDKMMNTLSDNDAAHKKIHEKN